MSEEERKEKQKPVTSKLAKVSFVCGISVWAVLVFGVIVSVLLSIPPYYTNWDGAKTIHTGFAFFIFFGTIVLGCVSLISGIICLVIIKAKKQVFKGTDLAIAGIISSLLYLVITITMLALGIKDALKYGVVR